MLLMNGGNEHEAFWLLNTFGKKNIVNEPKFDGIDDFYKLGFPLIFQYTYIFNKLFKEHLQDLKDHFKECEMPDLMWV